MYADSSWAHETAASSSCITPGTPYILHCFPAHQTQLTDEHLAHLRNIADDIARRAAGPKPIAKVRIVGHAATWTGLSRADYIDRARARANNARSALQGYLSNAGLGRTVSFSVEQRADDEPLVDNMVGSSSAAAQHNRAINRRVEISLIPSSGSRTSGLKLDHIGRVWIFATANQLVAKGRSADRWRELVVEAGFTDVAIFVNGQPKSYRRTQKSETYKLNALFSNPKLVRATRDFFHAAKISIHLVSWIKPIERYISGCADALLPLCETIGARSILFDAEEPWYGKLPRLQLSAKQSQTAVADHFCRAFGSAPCCLGVTHIVGDPGKDGIYKTIEPLLQACDYSLPQAYTSSASKDRCQSEPGCLPTRAGRKWSAAGRTMVMGLRMKDANAGTWERDIEATDAIRVTPPAAFAADRVHEVAYWWLSALGSRKGKRRLFIDRLTRAAADVRGSWPPSELLSPEAQLCPPLQRCRK